MGMDDNSCQIFYAIFTEVYVCVEMQSKIMYRGKNGRTANDMGLSQLDVLTVVAVSGRDLITHCEALTKLLINYQNTLLNIFLHDGERKNITLELKDVHAHSSKDIPKGINANCRSRRERYLIENANIQEISESKLW
ncbi:hypothetical protein TNCT_188821 [Trichonephila clavata]|uniref:Uncharacterized protein n=1 Tax=Trichonephila clavata TaxID=2740835 RepID=A0A8X6H8A8_TRICU|nr:hypothetical protein TNCT_188821 [Trichonephila clavata]